MAEKLIIIIIDLKLPKLSKSYLRLMLLTVKRLVGRRSPIVTLLLLAMVSTSLGVFAEWCKADALRLAHRKATAPSDRDSVTRYLYSHPEMFRLRLIPVPSELDRDDLRLTVGFEEDWEHVHTLYDALGRSGMTKRP